MVEVKCKSCATPLVDGGVDWYCPSCDYREEVKLALPLKPCCIEAAKAERDRIVVWLRGCADWYDKNDDGLSGFGYMAQADRESADAIEAGEHAALEGEQHVDVLEAALPSVGTNGLYVCDSLGLSCTVIGHVEGWLEVKFDSDQSTCIVRPSRFNPQGSQP